ncbi:MAG: radical SAM family heme chaperone HemW [Elusimicrobiota bacterium]|jgi:oxygen-independent coproporphyrinogen-3 oxidase|nr:radical SAM family heme chaperone HemW [Elusimicrobiota bacterium]
MLGLYLHIPFCKSKCFYCDFASFAGQNSLQKPYVEALLKEAARYKNLKPKTLYIGGGTPSVLEVAELKKLLNGITKIFGPISKFKEATFEANPESITKEKLNILKDFGLNRLSLGMQTTQNKHLKLIGRAHNRKQFFKAYTLAEKYFNNINVDIIAALPKQTLRDFQLVLKETVALQPKHISVYGLQVEEGTKLYKDKFSVNDILYRKMLEATSKYLGEENYKQYEISNYAKAGHESLHNINYWENGQYLGLGVAAASYLKGKRSQNIADIKSYISKINNNESPIVFSETLKGKAKIGEQIILGLRKLDGINPTKTMLKFFDTDFNELKNQGLLIKTAKNLRLSDEGKYLANAVFRYFVEPF